MFQVKQQFSASAGRGMAVGFMCAVLALATPALAQSSRPGWGSIPYNDASGTGVTFRVWAPNSTNVLVTGLFNGWSTSATPLTQETTNGVGDGVWSVDVAGLAIASGSTANQYKYYIYYNGSGNYKHDPQSRWVTNPGGGAGNNDIIYDPTAFNWNGDNFTNPALSDLFVYELHMGTFPSSSSPSRFIAATNKLDYLKSLGISAVEVMPVAEFGNSGSSEGDDPAQPFAVDNVQYGGPDAFKTFVIACHARGLAVLLDVVHNHYGTGDLDMWNFDGFAGTNSQSGGGIYFFQTNTDLQITPYGATRPNFNSQQVDDYVSNNIAMWLSEYHVDGFRWDDPYTMTHGYNGSAYTTYIPAAGNLLQAINNMTHANYPGKISIAEDVFNTWSFDSSWDTGYPGYFTPVLTAAADASRNMNNVQYAVLNAVSYSKPANSTNRVAYLESHDVVYGPNGGKRLVTAIDPVTPNSYRARKLSTLGAAVTLTAPGVPMIYQGQEMLESNAFYSYTPVDWTKTNTYSGIVQLYRDLITARRDLKGYTPGLEGDQCSMLWVDNTSKLIAFHRWRTGATNQDAMVIANFGNTNYPVYNLNFPYAGTWYVHFNTDSTNYSSDFGNNGSTVVNASGSNPATASVAIGPYSALILSPTPDAPPQLTITPTNGAVVVSWPNTYSEWVLDSCQSLSGSPPSWSQIPTAQYQTTATSIFISVPAPSGNTFYRLRKS